MYTIKVRQRFRLFARKKNVISHDISEGWLKLVTEKGIESIREVFIRSLFLYPDYYAHLREKRAKENHERDMEIMAKEQAYKQSMQTPVNHPVEPRNDMRTGGWETEYNQEALRRATERVNGLQSK